VDTSKTIQKTIQRIKEKIKDRPATQTKAKKSFIDFFQQLVRFQGMNRIHGKLGELKMKATQDGVYRSIVIAGLFRVVVFRYAP
jgi:hypothetical protein